MAEEFEVSPQQIRQAAERAMAIEQQLLRKAWGFCYAVIAAEIGLTLFLPFVLRFTGVSSDFGLFASLGVNTTVSLIGLAVTAWVLRNAYNAMLIRREIVDSVWTRLIKRPLLLALMWVVYYAPVLAAIFFLSPHALAVEFGLLATLVVPFYFVLKVSFPEKLPPESIAVIMTFAVCSLGSFAASFPNAHVGVYVILWSAMVAVSAFASAYARMQKPVPPEDAINW